MKFYSFVLFLFCSTTGLNAQEAYEAYNKAFLAELELVEKSADGTALKQEVINLVTDWNHYLLKDIGMIELKLQSNIPDEQKPVLENEKAKLELIYQENLTRLNGKGVKEAADSAKNVEPDSVLGEVPTLTEQASSTVETESEASSSSIAQGLVFKIQIAALSKKREASDLATQLGISEKVEMYELNGLFKYTVGSYNTLAEAKAVIEDLTIEGISPFVVAFKEGIRIPLSDISSE